MSQKTADFQKALGGTTILVDIGAKKVSIEGSMGDAKGISLVYLGSSANKVATRIRKDGQDTAWVFCFNRSGGKTLLEKEVAILLRLGAPKGKLPACSVPAPFSEQGLQPSQLVFPLKVRISNGDGEADSFGVIMEYFPIGAGKVKEFSKDSTTSLEARQKFIETSLPAGKVPAPEVIKTLRGTFNSISERYRDEAWSDFQVLFNIETGVLTVFDPFFDSDGAVAARRVILPMLNAWDRTIMILENAGGPFNVIYQEGEMYRTQVWTLGKYEFKNKASMEQLLTDMLYGLKADIELKWHKAYFKDLENTPNQQAFFKAVYISCQVPGQGSTKVWSGQGDKDLLADMKAAGKALSDYWKSK